MSSKQCQLKMCLLLQDCIKSHKLVHSADVQIYTELQLKLPEKVLN